MSNNIEHTQRCFDHIFKSIKEFRAKILSKKGTIFRKYSYSQAQLFTMMNKIQASIGALESNFNWWDKFDNVDKKQRELFNQNLSRADNEISQLLKDRGGPTS